MRDLLLTLLVFGTIPFIFVRPFVGVLVLSWLGFMAPHGLTFGYAQDLPFSKIILFVTALAFVFYKDKAMPRSSAVLWLFFFYVLWSTVTTLFALYPEDAMVAWGDFMKVVIISLFVILMTNNKRRLHMLLAVVVLSVTFYGLRGGVFTIITGGEYTVWGPELSKLRDNNALGLCLVMCLPLLWYMKDLVHSSWAKYGLLLVAILTAFAILGTHSRGAFLGIVAMTGFLVMKSRAKFMTGFAVILLAPVLYAFMPQSWHDRMDSIVNYQQDESAMMRINAWEFAINIANDYPVTGAGYDATSEELFSIYSNRPEIPWTGPHSIYFETLGDHGWVGLCIYLLLGIALYRSMSYIMKESSKYEDMLWMKNLAAMIQVSIVGFAVSGAFLELAKLDLYIMLIVFSIVMLTLLKDRQDEEKVNESSEVKKYKFKQFTPQTAGAMTKSSI